MGRLQTLMDQEIQFHVMPKTFYKSILNMGDPAILSTMLQKLKQKECLNILAIGGSICAGSWLKEPQADYAFPAVLGRYLDSFFPCNQGNDSQARHVVHNRCVHGIGTNFYLQAIRDQRASIAQNIPRDPSNRITITYNRLMEADVVLLDFTLNDKMVAGDYWPYLARNEKSQREMEAMIQIMINLPKFPSILYVGTAMHYKEWVDRMDFPRLEGDIAVAQREVTMHYHLPFVSVIDAFGPFNTPEKHFFWYDKYLLIVRGLHNHHPSEFGHKLIAIMMLNFIILHSLGDEFRLTPGSLAEEKIVDHRFPSNPLVLTKNELRFILSTNSKHISMGSEDFSNLGGWTQDPDVPSITATQLNSTTLSFPLIGKNITEGMFGISLLKSNVDMGIIEVQFINNLDASKVIDKVAIDCLWSKNASEVITFYQQLPASVFAGAVAFHIIVNIKLLPSMPPRSINRVKLYSAYLF